MGENGCELTYKEFELLYYMICNRGVVLSRDKIMDAVWGLDVYKRQDEPGRARLPGRVHPDGDHRHRRAQYPGARAEAADLLRLRIAARQAGRAAVSYTHLEAEAQALLAKSEQQAAEKARRLRGDSEEKMRAAARFVMERIVDSV